MKQKHLIIIIIIIAILFRSTILNFIINTSRVFTIKDENLEIKVLEKRYEKLYEEYNNLLNFKNNIKIKEKYLITNILKNNYGFGNLIIPNGDYKIGDEVLNEEGIVGIVFKKFNKLAEVKKIYDTNMIVKINNETGKIHSKDENLNLIIKDVTNYNNIKVNDLVYSVTGNYIGKVIKIKYDVLDNYLTVKTVNFNNLSYVAVITEQL